MSQDLTVLHSAVATREKQGKNQKYKNQNTHQYKYSFASEIINCHFGKTSSPQRKRGTYQLYSHCFHSRVRLENYYSSKKIEAAILPLNKIYYFTQPYICSTPSSN